MNEGRTKNEQPELTEEEQDRIEDNINALLGLRNYTIPTLRILSKADEEDVAEIFRRVNSGGKKDKRVRLVFKKYLTKDA